MSRDYEVTFRNQTLNYMEEVYVDLFEISEHDKDTIDALLCYLDPGEGVMFHYAIGMKYHCMFTVDIKLEIFKEDFPRAKVLTTK